MGGHITLRAMIVSDEIKAGVIWAGMVAPQWELIFRWARRPSSGPTRTPAEVERRRRWGEDLVRTYGGIDENPAFWATISPASYLSDLSGPV